MKLAPAVRRGGVRHGGGSPRLWLVLVLLGVAATVFMTIPTRNRLSMCGSTKQGIAEVTVKKYAWEAYPSWVQANPSRACPAHLRELDEYMPDTTTLDPWGTDYRWACTPRFIVWSAGPDGTFGSNDDIGSGP